MTILGFHVCPDEVRLLVALLQQHGADLVAAARSMSRVLRIGASVRGTRG